MSEKSSAHTDIICIINGEKIDIVQGSLRWYRLKSDRPLNPNPIICLEFSIHAEDGSVIKYWSDCAGQNVIEIIDDDSIKTFARCSLARPGLSSFCGKDIYELRFLTTQDNVSKC